MQTTDQYRENARQCRELMPKMARAEDREALAQLAQAWEKVAAERERSLSGHKAPADA
jgi:hypothetical protein